MSVKTKPDQTKYEQCIFNPKNERYIFLYNVSTSQDQRNSRHPFRSSIGQIIN
jgi:hypothetical protein